jgi:purine-binding chemotaxis protein CheW
MSAPTPAPAASPVAGKYLTIALAGESYGIAVLQVREIIRLPKITPVPQMPSHVKGVINLRGRVIPIVDLRAKFGLEAVCAERTCVVVVQVRAAHAQVMALGLIVDSVDEVVSLAAADVEPAPDFGPAANTSYLLGMAKLKGRVMTLLDIDRVVAPETVRAIAG